MKQPKGAIEEIGEEIKETAKKGREQVSLGKAFEDLLRQIFGTARPLSSKEEKAFKQREEVEKRKARARVLEEFMPSPKEEGIYYQRQKEKAIKEIQKEKEAKKKAWESSATAPKGRKKVGSLFEFLKRKVTRLERKIGGDF